MITSIGYQRSSFTSALIQNCDHTVGIKPELVVMNQASENSCFIRNEVKQGIYLQF